MPHDVQTLTGHAVIDVPIRNAHAQQAEASNVCIQEVQSTWSLPQRNGDAVTTQGQGGGSKCGGYPSEGSNQSQGIPKCSGLPSLELNGLDSRMGPFDPNRQKFEEGSADFFKNPDGKHGKSETKCGGSGGVTSGPAERRMTKEEHIIEQKLIEQKLREMKLRERYGF